MTDRDVGIDDDRIDIEECDAREADAATPSDGDARAPYVPPRLERLGAWSALTLQQSIPVFP